MSNWTCASCGQAMNRPTYKCAVCLQTEAIEEQTRILRQIHNIPEPKSTGPSRDESGVVVGILFFIFLFFMWLFGVGT
jgi:predicted ATP-dependent serine protease